MPSRFLATSIDFSKIKYDENPVGKFDDNSGSSSTIIWWIIILVMIITVTVIVFIKKRQHKVKFISDNNCEFNSQVNELTEVILKRKGEILDLNELNILFGIENLTPAKRRVKRSKLINDINYRHNISMGNDLIFRIINDTDKRYVRYKLG